MAGIAVNRGGLSATRKPITSLRRDPAAAWHHVDVVLVGALAAVSLLGVVMVYSSTRGDAAPYDTSFLKKQVLFMVLGAAAATATALWDYHRLRDLTPAIYGITMFLLVAVLVVGSRRKGTQGWFQLGPFQLQPSEFAKVALILGMTYMAGQYRREIDGRRLLVLLGLAAVPIFLVLIQPDLGTALVSAAIGFVLLVAAGVKGRYLALLGVGAILFAGAVLNSGMLEGYQKARLTVFASQERVQTQDEARGVAYNLEQSKIAIGSGGLWGKGLFEGPQTRLGNVPEQHTDFIFTVVGEELGLVGAAGLLGLYGVIVWRIWRTAQIARDDVGAMLCIGVLAMLVFQIFQNVGMTMGITPITGIPLPFMSYGGSSTLMAWGAMGVVLNVHMHRFR